MRENRYIKRAILLNPLVIIFYGIMCYSLKELAQYGGVKRRVPIIILILSLLMIWFIYSFFKIRRSKPIAAQELNNTISSIQLSKMMQISKWWFRLAILMILLITSFTGYKIYQSSIPYNGKLSWVLQKARTEREVPFHHNNIYENGLLGLIEDVNQEVDLPKKLYITNELNLSYNQDGEITNFYGFLYGQSVKGETETFLLSYDKKKNTNIQIYLDNYLEATYNEDQLLQPLIDGLEIVPLKEMSKEIGAEQFDLSYTGFEHHTSNLEGVNYYYHEEGLMDVSYSKNDYVGYSFKIEEADNIKPSKLKFNFVYYDPSAIEKYEEEKAREEAQAEDPNYFPKEGIAEEYFLNEKIGFQLVETDAALGSRFYGLRKTEDGGFNWVMHNENPFLDRTGVAAGLTFIDEELGFIVLSHNGGNEANLFRTSDGGLTFEQVELPSVSVTQNGAEFEPFDFPEPPIESNGKLTLYVNQGTDGDYQNNAKAVYISKNRGKSFEFVEIEH